MAWEQGVLRKQSSLKQACKMTTAELQRAPCTMCMYTCVCVCVYIYVYILHYIIYIYTNSIWKRVFGNVSCIFCSVCQCEQVKMWTLLCSLLHQINSFLGNTAVDLCWSCLHQIQKSASVHLRRHNVEKQTWPSTCLVVLNCLREVVVLFLLTAPHSQIQWYEVGPSCDLQELRSAHCVHSRTKDSWRQPAALP